MSVVIGRGLKPDERNRHVRRAREYLKENEALLFGKGVLLETKLLGTLTSGNRVRRGRVVFEGIFTDAESYDNFLDDVEKLSDEIRAKPGFTTIPSYFCRIGNEKYSPMNRLEKKTYPLQARTTLNLFSAKEAKYSETWNKFKKDAGDLARKYSLDYDKKYFGKHEIQTS